MLLYIVCCLFQKHAAKEIKKMFDTQMQANHVFLVHLPVTVFLDQELHGHHGLALLQALQHREEIASVEKTQNTNEQNS